MALKQTKYKNTWEAQNRIPNNKQPVKCNRVKSMCR